MFRAQHLSDHQRKRVHVGSSGNGPAVCLFRSKVSRRTASPAAARLPRRKSHAEIHHHGARRALRGPRNEHHICRLEIPVNDSGVLSGLYSGADLLDQWERIAPNERTVVEQVLRQGVPREQFHRQQCGGSATVVLVVLCEIVNTADVRMGDAPCQLNFLLQQREQILAGCGALANCLESNTLAQFKVFGFVHLAHPAASDEPCDSEAPCQQRGVGKPGACLATSRSHKCNCRPRE